MKEATVRVAKHQWAGLATALIVLLSLYLLLAPHPVGGGKAPDWVGHLVLFFTLGTSTGLLVRLRSAASWRRGFVLGLIAMICYGPLTEVAQGFTGRSPEWRDAAVDLIAALPAFLVAADARRLFASSGQRGR